MIVKQISLFEANGEVYKICKHLSKVENRFYCSYFEAFLSDEVLTVECDFLEVKK